jgi:hypothetical protein
MAECWRERAAGDGWRLGDWRGEVAGSRSSFLDDTCADFDSATRSFRGTACSVYGPFGKYPVCAAALLVVAAAAARIVARVRSSDASI